MAYDIKNLNVASLDFDDIKSSLISFLEKQQDLKDLDYRNDASAINLLLNILATVTAYNGVYAQYGYINSFATTTTLLESLLGIASNNSILLTPTLSASSGRTVTTTNGVTLGEYSTFTGRSPNGADVLFFNTESIPANKSKSITLYSGSGIVNYTGYNYETQSCEVPYSVNPETINFYETDIATNVTTKWTRVDKTSTTNTSNNTHYTVINGPRGYIVTNNFKTAKPITTSSKIVIKTITSNGDDANSSTIFPAPNTSFGTTELPKGGYDLITVNRAKATVLFKGTGQDRCVTVNDYKNAIMSSGISGTENLEKITVVNGSYPGQVKIYVSDLSILASEQLMDYLANKIPAGISIIYSQ